MIGDREHICKDENEVKRAVKNRMRLIYAYGDIELSERLSKKIIDKRILVIGVDKKDEEPTSAKHKGE